MKLAILSRGPELYSTQSLLRAALDDGHEVMIVDHSMCKLVIEDKPSVYFGYNNLNDLDAIIPRVGSSITYHGASVIKQFETMGVFTTVKSECLLQARNKLKSMQMLMAGGLKVPRTVFGHHSTPASELLDHFDEGKLIIKLLHGTHGLGVILAENKKNAEPMIETLQRLKERFILQEFIAESKGSDLRAIVVGGEVVASMKRVAQPGEFRSNLHRGASSIPVKLSAEEEKAAIKATQILGLGVSGVDMLQSDRGPLILEVNPSPGLEGIETTTHIDISGKIMHYIHSELDFRKITSNLF